MLVQANFSSIRLPCRHQVLVSSEPPAKHGAFGRLCTHWRVHFGILFSHLTKSNDPLVSLSLALCLELELIMQPSLMIYDLKLSAILGADRDFNHTCAQVNHVDGAILLRAELQQMTFKVVKALFEPVRIEVIAFFPKHSMHGHFLHVYGESLWRVISRHHTHCRGVRIRTLLLLWINIEDITCCWLRHGVSTIMS